MAIISVIVPVYKVEKFIHRCIDSILNQTFTDFELILVDDGSPDKCGAICDEYAERDNRIHVIHKENGGLSDARNAGIDWAFEKSNSEWMTFIDSDDWVHPEYLNYLYKAVTENDVGLSVTRYIMVNDYQNYIEKEYICLLHSTQEIFVKERVNMIIAWGKLFRKNDFYNIRFPVGKLHEDEFTTYKLLFMYDKIAFVDVPLYYYYVNPDSIINSRWNLSRLVSLDAFEQQMVFFKEKELWNAYDSSANALFTSCSRIVKRLRNNYPKEHLLRMRYIRKYYILKITGYEKYITDVEKKRIFKEIHPKCSKFFKWIKKKKSNALELIFNK